MFAQAKAAAKTTQSLSNMKQIGTGLKIYLGDNDDVYPQRKYDIFTSTGAKSQISWKGMIYPYVKSTALFTDTVNQAAKYPDDTSEPTLLAIDGKVPSGNLFQRGYFLADLPFMWKKDWGAATISDTEFENPANTLVIGEHKRVWVDGGPYLDWTPSANYPGDPITGMKYPWGGNKWDNKAMVLVFHDSHAKRAANSAICGKDNELNMWGYQRNQLNAWGAMGDVQWLDTFCQTMPAEVR
ncbi:hypothetical protein OP10G_4219 [Fimbriimonas ginsengisoli Gsoil 348]|uniref:DUF1559 domain-containing protein n=1 Tax=Fimbriimonas ginsengisoli Gsoil 348 TaxID=661478 RepID=A0A068NW73_FIMGI|nr:hypothetical protein OP10G_4219 [Fimbriimonas ginsengisoli Gsoil 348]